PCGENIDSLREGRGEGRPPSGPPSDTASARTDVLLDRVDASLELVHVALDRTVAIRQCGQVPHHEALLLRELDQRRLDSRQSRVGLVEAYVRLIDAPAEVGAGRHQLIADL